MPNIIQVIKYEGDANTVIWKHPCEDFNLGSQLIVHESQEAIFFANGQALDLFPPGRYTLSTQNIPLVGAVVKFVTGGDSPFHCEVYFINKTEQIGIFWGTDSQVNYFDPNYNYYFPVGASGTMNLRVKDSRKLLVKVAGTATQFTRDELAATLKGPFMAKIKSYLPSVLSKRAIPIFDIDRYMEEFSVDLQDRLADECRDYGLELVKFWISTFVKPESDPTYAKLKSLYGRQITEPMEASLQQKVDLIHQATKKKKAIMEAEWRAESRKIEGYDWVHERAYDVAERLASNEGAGNIASMGAGLGMMGGMAIGAGGVISGIVNDALQPLANQPQSMNSTDYPNSASPEMLGFKNDIGQATPSSGNGLTAKSRLQRLEEIKDFLTEEEYRKKREEILASI